MSAKGVEERREWFVAGSQLTWDNKSNFVKRYKINGINNFM